MRHPKLQHACNAVLAERLERRQLLAGTGLDVTPTLNANSIVHALLGGNTGIVVTSFHLSAQQKGAVLSSGTFTNPGGVFGLGNGIIMSTGDVSQYTSPPPTSPQTSTQYGGTTANSGKATDAQEALLVPISGNQISHFDVTELDLTFNMPKTLGQIFFNVVFGSAEFPQFVGSEFKDAFGLYVNGTNIATVDRQPVNIDHPAFVADTHTALNGLLAPGNDPLLHFSTFVGAGTRNNHLTFIVGDTSDHALDTTVYISALGALPPNPNIPVATVSAPDVTASQPTATFTVTYTDPNVPIQVGSIDSNDLIVTGPNGYSQIATLISVDNPTDGSPRVATYSVTGPSGGPFTVADDGTYVVSMQFQQVQDTAGDFVTEGGLGSFAVAVPGVTLAADPTFNAGTPKYNFSVTYIDPTGVKLTTIDNSDILVTNPANSFSQLAKRVSVSSDGDGRFTANYSLAAPNGKTWAVIDAGSYTFALQNGAVLDLNGSALPAGTLGTVVLTPFGGLSAPAAGEIPASGGAVAVAGDALGRQFIAYFDTVDSDLKYFTRMPNGAVSPDRVIDASPGAGAQLAIAVQHNLPVVAYYDSTAQQLKFARMINGVWHKTVVDQTGNVGQNPSIAIDAAGNAAISYYDVTNGDLKVARQTGKTFSVTTIDSTGDVGLFSSIALNPATHLLGIAYQDTTGGVLKLATEGTSGFTPAAIPGTIATGQAPSLAFDSAGNTFVSFFNSLAAGGPAVDVLEFTNSAWATVEHFTLSGAGATAGSIETIFPTAATAALPLIVFTDTASHALLLGQHSTTTGDATSMLFNDAGPIAAASAGATNKLDLITQPTGAAYSLLLIQDATAIAPAVPAGVFNATIPANAEISGAGNAGLPDATGGVAPIGFNIPAGVTRVQLSSVTGTISLNSGAGTNDADGVVVTGTYPTTLANASQMGAFGGLSGITIPGAGALVGVFVGATVPSGSPPADLDYTTLGTTAASSTPLLNQVFYIGDGKTADGSGAVQSFIIPSGATKLFLGISDAQNFAGAPGSYGDNSGNFAVTLNFGG